MRKTILLLLVGLVLALVDPGGARAAEDLVAMTNADRAGRGLGALTPVADLQEFAQWRADEMMRAAKLWHSADLGSQLSNWQRLGENVGRGPTLTDIQTSFMASPSHRDNIVLPQFTQIGVGVTSDGGEYVYVAVVFRQPIGAAAAPAPRQAAAPAPAPARPAPKPVARPAAPKPAPTTTTTTPPPPPPPAPEPEPVVGLMVPDIVPDPVVPPEVARPPVVEQPPRFLAASSRIRRTSAAGPPDRRLPSALAGGMIGLIGAYGVVHQGVRRRLDRAAVR